MTILKHIQKNILLGVTCRPSLNNNSHILLVRHISIDRLLNPDKDNNNNQNSSSNASSTAVGDNSNNTLSEESNNNLPPQQVSDAQAIEDRNVEDETNRSENEMDLDRPDDGDEMDVDPSESDYGEVSDEDVAAGKMYDLLECPAKDLPEDRLRDHLHTLREDLYNPSKEMLDFIDDNPDTHQDYIERLEELKDELQRRKDEGIIPDNTDSESSSSDSESSSSHSENIPEDLNSSNTQSGGSGDNGVGTSSATTSSATTNNQSSTGSDSFSRVSNEKSPDSFDNSFESNYLFESDYLLDFLNLDSSILEFIILYLPYVRIVLLLLPVVLLLLKFVLFYICNLL
jgi:hypothetical protein